MYLQGQNASSLRKQLKNRSLSLLLSLLFLPLLTDLALPLTSSSQPTGQAMTASNWACHLFPLLLPLLPPSSTLSSATLQMSRALITTLVHPLQTNSSNKAQMKTDHHNSCRK